jgi:hypothetical protein
LRHTWHNRTNNCIEKAFTLVEAFFILALKVFVIWLITLNL